MVDRVRGFAGMYYDESDGTPVVLLTFAGDHAAASMHAPAFAKSHPRRLGEPIKPLRFAVARYDFRQLRRWYTRALAVVATAPGLAYTDVDEVNNVIKIAVVDVAAVTAVNRLLAGLNIPSDAIAIPIEKPLQFQGAPSTPAAGWTTADKIRPATGGLLISTSVGNCTLGFNTQKVRSAPQAGSYVYDFQHYFVTVAHCMAQPGYSSGTIVAQGGTLYDNAYWIGQERRQPRWLGTQEYADCPTNLKCSTADAALIAYSYADGAMAAIARPTGYNNGNTTFDPFEPYFYIADSTQRQNSQLAGTLVSSVKGRSGWTSGYTRGTCTNQPYYWPGYYLLCSDTYAGANTEGDSGSPVFQVGLDGISVRMVGIHWGGDGGTVSAMSPYVNVRWELTMADYNAQCGSIWECWLGLNVSGDWW